MKTRILILNGLLIAGCIHAADQPRATEFKKWEPYPVWEERDVPNPNPGQKRPNILWIVCEDISPYLGCYGFEQALTPNLDKLAENGVRFTRAYSAAPVCAVARSALLTGMHSPTLGTHGMRVRTTLPPVIEAYPALFKKAGYYCTNNSKRYIYNGGTQVPLIVYVPEKWKHLAPGKPGTANDELVQFVDLPKTVLSICGIDVPDVMQGRVFMGPDKEPAPKTMICYRDRMGDRFDCSRAITDGEHYLIRNFYPHRPRGRDTRYGYKQQANWREWEAWYDGNPEAAGPVHSQFFKPKPPVELFDMARDPDQLKNLAADPALEAKLKKLDAELDAWMIRNRDLGLVPESMLFDMTGDGKKYETLYEYGQSSDYPVEKILAAAKLASSRRPDQVSFYLNYLGDEEPAVRYWGAYALFLNRIASAQTQKALKTMIKSDSFAANRIMAAQALAWCGDADAAHSAIMKEIHPEEMNGYTYLLALNALQYSHTDKNLTKEDWLRFKQGAEGIKKRRFEAIKGKLKGKSASTQTFLGFMDAIGIIDDALGLWPERRRVD